jgi:ketosteroid isomerase-like protein
MISFFVNVLSLSITMVTVLHSVDSTKEIIEVDAQLNLLIIKNDAAKAADFYTEDFILVTSGGKIITKKDIVDQIASPELKLEINETSEVKVRVHGTTAVLTGVLRQKGSFRGKSFDAKLYVTDTWIKTKKGWKILSGQAGNIPLL